MIVRSSPYGAVYIPRVVRRAFVLRRLGHGRGHGQVQPHASARSTDRQQLYPDVRVV